MSTTPPPPPSPSNVPHVPLVQLLARGCHEIFIFDASQDGELKLGCLFETLTLAEDELGIRVDFEVHHHPERDTPPGATPPGAMPRMGKPPSSAKLSSGDAFTRIQAMRSAQVPTADCSVIWLSRGGAGGAVLEATPFPPPQPFSFDFLGLAHLN